MNKFYKLKKIGVIGVYMNKYYIQEKMGDFWFDLYTSDLCMLKNMIIALKKRNPSKKYRIVSIYQ